MTSILAVLLLSADGSVRRRCKRGEAFAFTTPGSRLVYVCGPQLKSLAARSPSRAQAVIIHETLHTLGLGEDPPSPAEHNREGPRPVSVARWVQRSPSRTYRVPRERA